MCQVAGKDADEATTVGSVVLVASVQLFNHVRLNALAIRHNLTLHRQVTLLLLLVVNDCGGWCKACGFGVGSYTIMDQI